MYLWLLILAGLVLLFFALSYLCFFLAFYVPEGKKNSGDGIDIPKGEIYEVFRELMTEWAMKMRAKDCQEIRIRSFDGLELYGRFYEYAPGAPIELMFHGYRGSAERDLSGGVERASRLGRSVLLVDQRGSGKSGGNVISFGINEHRDCLSWLLFMRQHFGPDVKIILTGISMGASTVLMAADKDLPENVIGILADCGFTTARDIIKKVLRQIHLPAWFFYPIIRFSARLFGHFELEADSALNSLKNSRVPVIFFHGESDDFVPCDMSRENYEACSSRKAIVTVPGAGHGLSYPVDPDRYLDSLREFFGPGASYGG